MLINWKLLANPANWLIVFFMLAFAGLVVTLVSSDTFAHPAQTADEE